VNVSVVCTVKNEERSIARLLDSLLAQSRPPDEIVVVDGGSTDETVSILRRYHSPKCPLQVIVLPGCNISEGRNAAIAAARWPLIACTDAGVRLHQDWLRELEKGLVGPDGALRADVASGFFVADVDTPFECAMGATVLPTLEDVKPDRFLPSSRSVAFTKEAWAAVGGYPDWLDYCEDLVFDLDLKAAGMRFAFVPAALVSFLPRGSVRSYFRQYYLYARGDGKAGLWTKRHLIRYGSYGAGALAMLLGFWYKGFWLVLALAVALHIWRPTLRLRPLSRQLGGPQRVEAVAWIPVIRLVGDVAKMIGYPVGIWWRYRSGRSGGWVSDRHRQL
jgi:glycosyltransferase involved in cell wall biosynthesis